MTGSVSKHFILTAAGLFAAVFPLQAATVSSVQGEVSVHRAGTAEDAWEALADGAEVKAGDSVKTQNGGCTLVYGEQGEFAVDPQTTLEVRENDKTQDLALSLGKVRGKINKEKVLKPFQVITPTAVAAIRGTVIDVGYTADGVFAVDLHNGKIQVLNEDLDLAFDLEGSKQIRIKYLKDLNKLTISNECGSDGSIIFNMLGIEHTANPCDSKEIDLSTAADEKTLPDTPQNNDGENPDEGRYPISPTS